MTNLSEQGCVVVENYLDAAQCEALLERIADFRKENPLPEIHRATKGRPLRYKVMDGEAIEGNFPFIWDLYNNDMLELVREQAGEDINLLSNLKVGVNVNIMAPQGNTYRWHYDRNAATAILYLNKVEGGETVLFPNYRIHLKNLKLGWLQNLLDKFIHIPFIRDRFTKRLVVPPSQGKLVIMAGNKCWHSVRPVFGDKDRINIIFAFDKADIDLATNPNLDRYLYTDKEQEGKDPNYKK